MKLIWHIIRKDIVRERWALLLWVLLFVAQIVLGVVVLRRDAALDATQLADLKSSAGAMVFLQVVLGYVLVARLVQADVLIGTNMFWRTRPISAVRLLTSKMIGTLLLFAVLPVLVLLPWWLYCHFGARIIFWAAVETVGWQLLMIAPAFLVASLTDDLGRVLLWTLLLVIGVLSWMIILQSFIPAQMGLIGIGFTRLWLSGLVLVMGSVIIVAHQFLTRRFIRSVVLTAFMLGVIALIGRAWPWDWSKVLGDLHRPAPAPNSSALADGVSVEVGRALQDGVRKITGGETMIDLKVPLKAYGVPADMIVTGGNAVQTWSWAAGPTFTRNGHSYFQSFPRDSGLRKVFSLPELPDDPETVQWWKARRDKANADRVGRGLPPNYQRPPLPMGDWMLMSISTMMPQSIMARIRQQPPTYEATVQCVLWHPEIVIELPLKPDARGSSRSQTFRLNKFALPSSYRKGVIPGVGFVSTVSSVEKAGLWQGALTVRSGSGSSPRYLSYQMALMNRATGDIRWAGVYGSSARSVQIGGVRIDWNSLPIRPPTVIRNGQWVIKDEQWLEHTTLVLMEDKEVARFARTVKTERLELESSSTDN